LVGQDAIVDRPQFGKRIPRATGLRARGLVILHFAPCKQQGGTVVHGSRELQSAGDRRERCNGFVERAQRTVEVMLGDQDLALHAAGDCPAGGRIGEFRDVEATPAGVLLDGASWAKERDKHLPSSADGDFIASLMKPVSETGQFASWISPPKVGIDNRPGDFEYVKVAA